MNPISLIIKNNYEYTKLGLYRSYNYIYFKELHDLQSKFKKYITDCPNWNKLKKMHENNIYNRKNDINNIVRINICSRSFLKLIEICDKFKLCDQKKINYLALAEAPGGFIEAFINIRKNKFLGRNDNITTISLNNNKDIPKYLFKNKYNFNIKIFYGINGDGDLYNLNNILSIRSQLNEKYNFITADGGIDFSKDYNNQEESIYKLLYSEILTSFIYLEKQGDFILKIFDIFQQKTIELIYILSNYFEQIIIYKPYLSRDSNSEKYLICTKFKGISDKELKKMILIFNIMNNHDISNYKLLNYIPEKFINKIYDYNKIIIENQIKNILKTILKINNCKNILNNYNWCKIYNINSYK